MGGQDAYARIVRTSSLVGWSLLNLESTSQSNINGLLCVFPKTRNTKLQRQSTYDKRRRRLKHGFGRSESRTSKERITWWSFAGHLERCVDTSATSTEQQKIVVLSASDAAPEVGNPGETKENTRGGAGSRRTKRRSTTCRPHCNGHGHGILGITSSGGPAGNTTGPQSQSGRTERS